MELLWLVYVINLLGPINSWLSSAIFFVFFGSVVCTVIWGLLNIDNSAETFYKVRYLWYVVLPIILLASLFRVLLPNEKTAYMMVGAYVTQQVYTDENTQRLAKKVMTVVEGKIDLQIKELGKQADELGKKAGKLTDDTVAKAKVEAAKVANDAATKANKAATDAAAKAREEIKK